MPRTSEQDLELWRTIPQIVVLDGGHVAGRGTHIELLRRGGLYAEMLTRQQSEREEETQEAAE